MLKLITDRIQTMGEGNVFTHVCLSVHTPPTCYTAVSMPFALTQEDFLVVIENNTLMSCIQQLIDYVILADTILRKMILIQTVRRFLEM